MNQVQRKWLMLGTALFVLFIAGAFYVSQRQSAQFDANLAALEKVGAQVKVTAPTENTDDAAPDYKAVVQALAKPTAGTTNSIGKLAAHDVYGIAKIHKIPNPPGAPVPYSILERLGPLPATNPKEVAPLLEAIKPAFEVIDRASNKGFRISRNDYFEVDNHTAPGLGLTRSYGIQNQIDIIVQLLFIRAAYRIETSDEDGCIDSMREAVRIVKQPDGGGPIDLRGQFSGRPKPLLNRLLAMAERYPNDAKLVKAIDDAANDLGEPKTAVAKVREAFPKVLERYKEAMASPPNYRRRRGNEETPNWLKDNPVLLKKAMEQTVAGWRKAFNNMPQDPNDVDAIIKAFQRQSFLASKVEGPHFDVLGESDLGMTRFYLSEFRLLRNAIHIFAYRAEHGSFPDSLLQIGADGTDPWSMKPFVYTKTKDGFLLYCAGEDQKDSGGIIDDSHFEFGFPQTEFIHYGPDFGIRYPM